MCIDVTCKLSLGDCSAGNTTGSKGYAMTVTGQKNRRLLHGERSLITTSAGEKVCTNMCVDQLLLSKQLLYGKTLTPLGVVKVVGGVCAPEQPMWCVDAWLIPEAPCLSLNFFPSVTA